MRHYLRMANRDGLVAGSAIGLVGLALLAAFARWTGSNIVLLATGHRADGTVRTESCHKQDCSSIIRYVDMHGSSRETTTASSNLSSGSVEILFHQQPEMPPTDVSINTFGMMWIGPLILALLGSILSLTGAGLFMQSLPPRKRRGQCPQRRGA